VFWIGDIGDTAANPATISSRKGAHDQITVANWFGAASSQLQEIATADGSKLDSQLS
jgi:hypothetical protein